MQVVALFSLVLASVSASALIARDGSMQNCDKYDAVRENKATCNDPPTLICVNGCTDGVTVDKCKTLGDYKPVAGSIKCDGGYTSASSGGGFDCQSSKHGSLICYGQPTGKATCRGCRPITPDDLQHLHDNQSPSQPVNNSSGPTGQPSQNTSSTPGNNPTWQTGGAGPGTTTPTEQPTTTTNATGCANKTTATTTGSVTTSTISPEYVETVSLKSH
ncbi:hypothetical protein CROQUDRAFT_656672 [Cronartium quercuum f. sp. fusiforme G11]|uniref:Secreted protein n=1 Tax=Cronartium quercuum f. sp. fusiforme G11 TaxID=708437 RepID=A0A9P6NHD8_9BASI|nr:hypothetical protein CROQUDRAFT_656672 [Cronartium quercuum f. sp. fusiforme G11]